MEISKKNYHLATNLLKLCFLLCGLGSASIYHIVDSEWMWKDGSNIANEASTRIIDDDPIKSLEYPGARSGATSWNSGKDVYLFGGYGYGIQPGLGPLNDLWKYNNMTSKWTLIDVSDPKPEARTLAASCGVPGLLYVIFGGLDTEKRAHRDLWIYYFKMKKWVPVVEASRMVPPRSAAAYWCLPQELVIFGGVNTEGQVLSDMWSFSLVTLKWTNVYIDPSSAPSARDGAITWSANINSSQEIYLFGGNSLPMEKGKSHIATGYMSDLWRYSKQDKTWALIHGDNSPHRAGSYGDFGIPNKSNMPGCRKHGASWVDSHGDLWLFGGGGVDKSNTAPMAKLLSDLWVYDIQKDMWVWLKGPDTVEQEAIYGDKMSRSSLHLPGPRWQASTWAYRDTFMLFGGEGHDKVNNDGHLNDLWQLTFNKPTMGTNSQPHGKLVYKSMSPLALLGVCFAGACGVALLFVLLMYAKKCWNSPRHKPVMYNIRYSSLIDEAQFEDDFTDEEAEDELFEQNRWRQNGKRS